MKTFLPALLITLICCTVVSAADVSAADAKFAQTAAMGGMFEIQSGQVAEKNGQAPSVKEMGAMMVKDHSKAAAELKKIATKQGIELPTKLDSKHAELLVTLESLKGDAFDVAYVTEMIPDHKKAIAAFQEEAKNGTDPELKAFAAKVLPIIEGHLQHFEHCQAEMKK